MATILDSVNGSNTYLPLPTTISLQNEFLKLDPLHKLPLKKFSLLNCNLVKQSAYCDLDQEPFDSLELHPIYNTGDSEDSSISISPSSIKKSSLFLFNYVQACVNAGFVEQAINDFISREQLSQQDMQCAEYLLKTLLKLPKRENVTLDVVDCMIRLFNKVLDSRVCPSAVACSCILAAALKYNCNETTLEMLLTKVEEMHSLGACLQACQHDKETRKFIEALLLVCRPETQTTMQERLDIEREHPLIVADFYETLPSNESILFSDFLSSDYLMDLFFQQLAMEAEGFVSIPNVLSCGREVSTGVLKQRKKLEQLHEQWSDAALKAFHSLKDRERRKWKDKRSHNTRNNLNAYPFLCLLPDKEYIDIIINHLCQLPKSGDLTINTVFMIGDQIYSRYALKQHLRGESRERLANLYRNYIQVFLNKGSGEVLRERWKKLEHELGCVFGDDRIEPWQNFWKVIVGKKLLEIMVSTFTVGLGGDNKVPSAYFKDTPAVYNSYKPWGNRMCGMTVPHPFYHNLVRSAKRNFNFEASFLPMVIPPMPWTNQHQGGLLCRPTEFVRHSTGVAWNIEGSIHKSEQMSAVYDALNIQASVMWKVNTRVLDVQLEMFHSKGDERLKIAPEPFEIPLEMRYTKHCSPEERKKMVASYHRLKKLRNEKNSLYADAMYKFSIANFFRDKLLWLPHNIDFRGRSYPTPPHFNYMGDDVSRSLFLFADGKPLGKQGMKWLKIHIINLTGKKKYEGLEARLAYAEQVIDDIIDSAENPLGGSGWWKSSEEPWQTLASCIELTNALKCSNPDEYVSCLPIHQDGSCNGLQHYAALGRDVIGASQVNLETSDIPQDVYAGVAEVVEKLRKTDAEKGVAIAMELEGFITRKVVKQTVMTTVYGVTRFGGAEQVRKKLALMDGFPRDKQLEASIYVAKSIFQSISSLFTSAIKIQSWLTDIANCIAKGGKPVEWVSPLGLHSIQPYFKTNVLPIESSLQQLNFTTFTSIPNVMKQRNAFPPNFVHSLDSTHMMLTALYCHRAGVKFSAVHDCYWSHACCVDQMNQICREQFIALHNGPILEELTHHLVRFLPEGCRDHSGNWVSTEQQKHLRQLLQSIPEKGKFDLNRVRNSTFFFS